MCFPSDANKQLQFCCQAVKKLGDRAGVFGERPPESDQTKKPKKVLATDTSVSTTMKNAAKRDMYCELQNSVNHQMFERSMQLWVSPVVLPP